MNARTAGSRHGLLKWPVDAATPLTSDASLAETPSSARPGAAPPQPCPAARAPHLLYIDDNPVNTLLLQEFFRLRKGPALQVAQTGGQGLAMARSAPPMAVLLDLNLPDMHGLDVLASLRADPRTCQLPVAMVSATTVPEQLQAALDQGADAVWCKPVDFNRIDQQLAELLAGRRS